MKQLLFSVMAAVFLSVSWAWAQPETTTAEVEGTTAEVATTAETEPITDRMADLLGPTFSETPLWGWMGLLGAIFAGLLAGKIVQFALHKAGAQLRQREWPTRGLVSESAASPASLALLTLGLSIGLTLVHQEPGMAQFTRRILLFLYIVALGWFFYNLVDVIDLLLRRTISGSTGDNKLDKQVVPLIRKTLRIFLVVVLSLFVAQNVFDLDVTGWLAGLGIAGLAVSLAAQDSVKNLFGSITVFFDKPFAVGDRIKFDGYDGPVEEIGFRSTKLRTLEGHLVTIPNMKFNDSTVENVSARQSIRRILNVTITYDTAPEKIVQAVQIIRNLLAEPEISESFDLAEFPPRVHFNDYNSASLNILVIYWFQLAGGRTYWDYLAHAERFNLQLFKAYTDAEIEFAFPTQTLYLAGDPNRELRVSMVKEQGA